MAEKTTTQQEIKKKKKKWVSILASPEFNNQEIGETFLEEEQQAMGRVVEVNLMMLTRDPKKQNYNVYFKVNEVKNNQANTELFQYRIQIAQLKKITKQGKNKVDDSFIYNTKDDKKVTIKPILITRELTYKTTLKLLRKTTRDFLTQYTKSVTAQQVMRDIISNNLQRDIKTNAKKVTPLINCIIKSVILHK
mgnify:CR=1 FL=1